MYMVISRQLLFEGNWRKSVLGPNTEKVVIRPSRSIGSHYVRLLGSSAPVPIQFAQKRWLIDEAKVKSDKLPKGDVCSMYKQYVKESKRKNVYQ